MVDDCTAEILALPGAGDLASLSFPLQYARLPEGWPVNDEERASDTESEAAPEGLSLLTHKVWWALLMLPHAANRFYLNHLF